MAAFAESTTFSPTRMEARLPLDKLERARQAAAKATAAGSISLVDIQSPAGLFSSLLLFTSRTPRLGLHASHLDLHCFVPNLLQICQVSYQSGLWTTSSGGCSSSQTSLKYSSLTRLPERRLASTLMHPTLDSGGSGTLTHTTYGGRMLFPRSLLPKLSHPIYSSHYVKI